MKRLMIVLAVFLTACDGGASVTPGPEPAPPSSSATPDASLAARTKDRDLSDIVLDAASAPEGTSLDEARATVAAVVERVVISGRESQFLELPGLSAARYSQFSGEGGLLLSLGVQFDTEENADHGFDLFLDELESEGGYGLDSRTSEEIGDEGKCTEGANRDLGGLHERICLWRTGRVILVAGGTLAWPDLYDLAHDMDSRAR